MFGSGRLQVWAAAAIGESGADAEFGESGLEKFVDAPVTFSGGQSGPFMVGREDKAVGPVTVMRHQPSPGAAAYERA